MHSVKRARQSAVFLIPLWTPERKTPRGDLGLNIFSFLLGTRNICLSEYKACLAMRIFGHGTLSNLSICTREFLVARGGSINSGSLFKLFLPPFTNVTTYR
jgi:hypothetical protein